MTCEEREQISAHALEYLDQARTSYEEGRSEMTQAAAAIAIGLSLSVIAGLMEDANNDASTGE